MTALVIISSGLWAPEAGQQMLNGSPLTSAAFESVLPGFGKIMVTIGVVLFGFSTILTWSYYGEKGVQYLLGDRSRLPYKMLFLTATFLGAIINLQLVWDFADVANALMALPNLIGIIALSGVVAAMAKKYFRLFLASNESWVVPADVDDRRYLVLDVSPSHTRDHDYFRSLDEEWSAGGQEAFYWAMLNRDISSFNHRERPETDALQEQKLDSLLGVERLIYELLCDGEIPVVLEEKEYFFVSTSMLRRYCASRGNFTTGKALSLELRIMSLNSKSERRSHSDFGQVRGFWLPELEECRDKWAQNKHLDITWPDDDGAWIDIVKYTGPI